LRGKEVEREAWVYYRMIYMESSPKLIAVHTSMKAVSVYKVTRNICDVVLEDGIICDIVPLTELDHHIYTSHNGSLIFIPFDLSFCLNYFYHAWKWIYEHRKRVAFYTTIEGDVMNPSMYEWIRRDLRFIANSKYTETKLRTAGFNVNEVIYHGIDLDLYDYRKYDEDAKMFREKLGLSKNDFVVLYIASSHPRKCHDLARQTALILEKIDPSIKLVVLTDENASALYRDSKNVVVLTDFGGFEESNMPVLYKSADIYAHFSCSEGFGLPVLEALSMGKMVVHPNYIPLNEITTPDTSVRVKVIKRRYIEGGGSAIVYELNIYDPSKFAEAIVEARKIVESEPSLPDRCRERASYFDMRKIYKSFVKYF